VKAACLRLGIMEIHGINADAARPAGLPVDTARPKLNANQNQTRSPYRVVIALIRAVTARGLPSPE
jgi:hypothetical protein